MTAGDRRATAPVVVTGMGVLCSIAADVASFAVALRRGCSGIERLGNGRSWVGAEIGGFDLAAALEARASLPEELRRRALGTARRSPLPVQAAVATASEAWEHARLHLVPVASERLGLVVAGHNLTGRYVHDLQPKFAENPAYLPTRFALHVQDSNHVGTLSQAFGITGEGYTVGGASASGNVGIINGSRLVESGAVDACLVVGALTDLSPMERQAYLNLGALADGAAAMDPKAVCRPFDRGSRGFVPGQGSACLFLEAAGSARRRGVEILAEVGGYELRLDGNSLASPSESGEAGVMAGAMRRAGLKPRQISYVNAHGSASPLGDRTEIAAVRRAFGESFTFPWINSTKALTGHCLCAAGVLEAVATIVQMRQGFVHPSLNLTRPIDPRCRFAGARAQPAKIEFALSNSFGFGGFNSAVLLVNPNR